MTVKWRHRSLTQTRPDMGKRMFEFCQSYTEAPCNQTEFSQPDVWMSTVSNVNRDYKEPQIISDFAARVCHQVVRNCSFFTTFLTSENCGYGIVDLKW